MRVLHRSGTHATSSSPRRRNVDVVCPPYLRRRGLCRALLGSRWCESGRWCRREPRRRRDRSRRCCRPDLFGARELCGGVDVEFWLLSGAAVGGQWLSAGWRPSVVGGPSSFGAKPTTTTMNLGHHQRTGTWQVSRTRNGAWPSRVRRRWERRAERSTGFGHPGRSAGQLCGWQTARGWTPRGGGQRAAHGCLQRLRRDLWGCPRKRSGQRLFSRPSNFAHVVPAAPHRATRCAREHRPRGGVVVLVRWITRTARSRLPQSRVGPIGEARQRRCDSRPVPPGIRGPPLRRPPSSGGRGL